MQPIHRGKLWLPGLRPVSAARLRVFCFPYAGASASAYARWADRLPAGIDLRPLQLPGRWNRLREAPLTRFDDVVRAVGNVLPQYLDLPCVFFGHSMGALLAFELVRTLRARGLPQPLHLFVSGHRAPQIADDHLPADDLDDQAFVDRLREYNGTPADVLKRSDLMALLLPTLRADFRVCRSYAYAPATPLACPITVFGGADDAESGSGWLEAWSMHTTARSTVHRFPGDHFYIHSAEALLLRALSASLNAVLATLPPASVAGTACAVPAER